MRTNRRNVRRRRARGRGRRNAMLPSVRALRSLNTPIVVRLGAPLGISSNGSGIVNTFIPCDPTSSGINFGEWADLAALYTSFRCLELSVQFCINSNPSLSGGSNGAPLMIGGSFSSLGAPGSYSAIAENADAHMWQISTDSSKTGYTHTLRLPRNLGFANIAVPVPGDFAGAPGAIQIFGTGFPNSTNVVSALIAGYYEFRSRS